jgi:broad-specificity NMP kinase
MLINLNGWPGVGKLTVGRRLATLIGARLIPNHAILDLAEAIADRGTTQFYEAVRSIRTAAFNQLALLAPEVPVVLTNVIVRGVAVFQKKTGARLSSLPAFVNVDYSR